MNQKQINNINKEVENLFLDKYKGKKVKYLPEEKKEKYLQELKEVLREEVLSKYEIEIEKGKKALFSDEWAQLSFFHEELLKPENKSEVEEYIKELLESENKSEVEEHTKELLHKF